jgi:hypothetical protein
MKKILSLITMACMAALVACGPSAEEKAAMEKARQDSIEKVQKATQDSIDMANKAAADKAKADSTAAADMEKARKDSMEAAQKKGMKKAAPASAKKTAQPANPNPHSMKDILKGKK